MTETRIAYYAPVEPGGLADYAVRQFGALMATSDRVVCLGFPFLEPRIREKVPGAQFVELQQPVAGGGKLQRVADRITSCRRNVKILVRTVEEEDLPYVLISSFSEYFAPFWAGPLRRLSRNGRRVGVVVHDPIRDFAVGPLWWHKWSVSQAYSFVHTAFLHNDLAHVQLDTGAPARAPERVAIPLGPFDFPCPNELPTKQQIRADLGVPANAHLLLSFGHLRDGKNLDLVIRALAHFPNCHLLVAGQVLSSAQKPVTWYQKLATDTGVSDRCHWFIGFVAETEVHRYFTAADALVLLYSEHFRSASAVLSAGSQFRLPVLASSGDGPLKAAVQTYGLGEWVVPDQLNAVREGLTRLLEGSWPTQNWDAYVADNSWGLNARLTLSHLCV